MNEILDFTHGLRKHVDQCIVEVDFLAAKVGRNDGGREVALAKTKLQEAKMWLGKVLEASGSELPKEFRDSSIEDESEEEEAG